MSTRRDLGTREVGEFKKPTRVNVKNERSVPVEFSMGFSGHVRAHVVASPPISDAELAAQVLESLERTQV